MKQLIVILLLIIGATYAKSDVVPPPPTIVAVMYGYERHCPISQPIWSRLINRELMLIPAKAEAQRAMAIETGEIMARRPDFCAQAEGLFIVAIQSGQYLDKQLSGAMRCADVRYLPDAEARQCLRYWSH